MVTGFLCMYSQRVFPLFFPLQVGNILDVLFHAVSAGFLHRICHMGVHVEGKSSRGMAQVSLYSLNVISCLYSRHSITMTKVMKSCVWKANGFHNTFIITPNHLLPWDSCYHSRYSLRLQPGLPAGIVQVFYRQRLRGWMHWTLFQQFSSYTISFFRPGSEYPWQLPR